MSTNSAANMPSKSSIDDALFPKAALGEHFALNYPLETFRAVYQEKVDLGYLFAKMTYLIDEAPFNYSESCEAVAQFLELVHKSLAVAQKDQRHLLTLVGFLRPKMTKLVGRVLIGSFLDSSIVEQWHADDLGDREFGHFRDLSLLLLGMSSEQWYLRSTFREDGAIDPDGALSNLLPPHIAQEFTLAVPTAFKIEIIDKLYTLAAQHPRGSGDNSSQAKYATSREKQKIFKTTLTTYPGTKYELCIQKLLAVGVPDLAMLRFLCAKFLAANCVRSMLKFVHVRSFLKYWHDEAMNDTRPAEMAAVEEEIASLEQLRDEILKSQGALTSEVCLLVSDINRLIFCRKYYHNAQAAAGRGPRATASVAGAGQDKSQQTRVDLVASAATATTTATVDAAAAAAAATTTPLTSAAPNSTATRDSSRDQVSTGAAATLSPKRRSFSLTNIASKFKKKSTARKAKK